VISLGMGGSFSVGVSVPDDAGAVVGVGAVCTGATTQLVMISTKMMATAASE